MKLTKIITSALALLITSVALAGLSQQAPVQVVIDANGNGAANGDQFTARTSDSPDVMIGCGTRNSDDGLGGVFSFAFCQARDAEGDFALCFTFNPQLVQAISANNSFAFITFNFRDDGLGGFECTNAGFSTQSFYLPELKDKTK